MPIEKNQINLISFFSGTGMLDVGAHAALRSLGFKPRTICYIENAPAAQKVLRARIRDGFLDDAPIIADVRDADGRRFLGLADAAIAGFPCQPFSVAGKRLGVEDHRYLFGEIIRVAVEAGLQLLLLENVPGLLAPDTTGEFRGPAPVSDVSRLLAERGFRCQWIPMGAEDVGAPHGRQRWWCIAWRELEHTPGVGFGESSERGSDAQTDGEQPPRPDHTADLARTDPAMDNAAVSRLS